ncbi:uncharacterized protein Dwil_GK22338 [Drosophila willistoni]|uniref:Uncharacterized protein n=1 Tax=Drosophila willistoni TaxID=7260 RepID=B4NF23_DROWI|nr:uncharacterized protein LOC6649462 [Drosophila willistoni]EDW83398.1 uncharacterized protein Dwil_GK22338 [Drosophila willistoni]
MRCEVFLIVIFEFVVFCVLAKKNRTELNHVVERVFSRPKRFVLFPKGSNLKFTGSFSKGLLAKYPSGVAMNIEEACYYPVPSSREDVYPKRFRPRTTTTPKPKTTTEPTYVWIPGTNWRFKATPLKKPKPLRLNQRIDLRPAAPSYVKPEKWAQWAKYGQRYENWTPPVQKYEKHTQPGKWSKWTTESPKWNRRWYRSAENTPYDPDMVTYEHISYPDLEEVADSPHYHGHRDRRQLFEQFEGFSKLFGMSTKACVMRAICDSKRMLLPQGYSMIQDIVRLIFTLPTISGVDDDYSTTMRMSPENCDLQFREQCKFNILAWFLSGKWQ